MSKERDNLAKLIAQQTADLDAAYRIVDIIQQAGWKSPLGVVVEKRIAWHEAMDIAINLHRELGKQADHLPKKYLSGPEQAAVEAAITASTGLTYSDYVLMITRQVHYIAAGGLGKVYNPYELVDAS